MFFYIKIMIYEKEFDTCLHGLYVGLRIIIARNEWWSEIMGNA